jgi:hypothetical protein
MTPRTTHLDQLVQQVGDKLRHADDTFRQTRQRTVVAKLVLLLRIVDDRRVLENMRQGDLLDTAMWAPQETSEKI